MWAEKGTLLAKTCGRCGARNAPEADYCIQCMESFGPLALPKPPQRFRGPVPSPGAIPPPPPPPVGLQGGLVPEAVPTASPTPSAEARQSSAQPAQAESSQAPSLPKPAQPGGPVPPAHEDPVAATAIPSDAEIAALLSGASGLTQAGPSITLSEDERAAGRQTLNEDGVGIVNGKPIWQCAHCDHLQPMANFVCSQCGTRFGAKRVDPVANANFKRMELMFPGYGFFQAGHLFTAITRILIATSWLATAIFVAFQRPIVALPLIAGVGVLWALGPQDIENVLLGHEPRLNGRGLLILITLVLLAFIFVGAADFYLGTSGLNQ